MKHIDFKLSDAKLKNILAKLHESDIAQLFEENSDERERIFKLIGIKKFSLVFTELNEELAMKTYLRLSLDQKKSLLRHLEIDDIKSFVELFKISYHDEIIKLLNKSTQEKVRKLLSYDGDKAGSISSPHFIVTNLDDKVKDATRMVIKESTEKDEIGAIFVNDEENKFVGGIELKDLIIARGNTIIKNIVNESYPYAFEDDSVESALRKIRDYDIQVLPVLNSDYILIGVITAEDALEFMEEEHIDRVEKLVSIESHDELSNPFKRSMNRLPWLLISVVLNIIIASFLTVFSKTIDQNVALVLFQPMILGMAGNIGTQSIAVTILGINQDIIEPKKHILREIKVASINSLLSGIIGVIIVYLFLIILPNSYGDIHIIALIVGLSLMLSMFISALIGVMIPFGLRKVGVDEKAASGPIISTVNDFSALGIYFLIATFLLMLI